MRLKKLARSGSLVLIVLLLIECFVLLQGRPKAEPVFPVDGIITAKPSCNMRQDPSTQQAVMRELKHEVKVRVHGVVQGQLVGDNPHWYEISYNQMRGFVSTQFVRLQASVPTLNAMPLPSEADFLADLKQQGFPEDYQTKLMALHRAHPAWRFKALHTNYSFDRAVSGEFRPGVNLVPATMADAYKSRADADFNFQTNQWRAYERGWVGASVQLIAYQMDPRNFLDPIQIFQFENQQYQADLPYEHGVKAVLQDSFMKGEGPILYTDTQGQGQSIQNSYTELLIHAGEQSGVNPYHLASRILQEVGPQGSGSVSGTYQDLTGYYNFYNIGATGGSDPVYQGLLAARDGLPGYTPDKLAKMQFPWTDPWRSIAGGAIFIGEDYITVDQQTLYLQKFNIASRFHRPFEHQYMGNVLAPEYEAIDVYKAYEKVGALDDPKEFLVPVFTDMPTVTASPTEGGNPNNWLQSLRVNGSQVTNFSPERFEYYVEILSATEGLVVEAFAYHPEARVNGPGLYVLKPGINEIVIQVQAPNSGLRNYRLSVFQAGDVEKRPSGAGAKLQDGRYTLSPLGYLYGAEPGTPTAEASQLVQSFQTEAGVTASVRQADGQVVQGAVATGQRLQLHEGGVLRNSFPIVVLGDANGDGQIDISDASAIYRYLIKDKKTAGTAFTLAMDVNQDGYSDISDANLIYQHVLGVKGIAQRFQSDAAAGR